MTGRDFPESPEAAHWRVVLSSVSLIFAIIATIAFALRAYASRLVSSKLRIEDVLMGIAVILMWADTAAALMSTLLLLPGQILLSSANTINRGLQWHRRSIYTITTLSSPSTSTCTYRSLLSLPTLRRV